MVSRAQAQHGAITLDQLRALGFVAATIRSRHSAGRLVRIHRGVYALPGAANQGLTRWAAAVLALGPGALLSHRSMAALHKLIRVDFRDVDVIAPAGRRPRRRPGVAVHRSGSLDPVDVARVEGIPGTDVARTLLDLAAVAPAGVLDHALRAAARRRIARPALERLLARYPAHRGRGRLRAALDRLHPQAERTVNDREHDFLVLCSRAGVEQPQANVWIPVEGAPGGGYRGDFVWASKRLIVETDGYETHGTAHAFEHDRGRDQRLALAGWRVVRITANQVEREPRRVVGLLVTLVGS